MDDKTRNPAESSVSTRCTLDIPMHIHIACIHYNVGMKAGMYAYWRACVCVCLICRYTVYMEEISTYTVTHGVPSQHNHQAKLAERVEVWRPVRHQHLSHCAEISDARRGSRELHGSKSPKRLGNRAIFSQGSLQDTVKLHASFYREVGVRPLNPRPSKRLKAEP